MRPPMELQPLCSMGGYGDRGCSFVELVSKVALGLGLVRVEGLGYCGDRVSGYMGLGFRVWGYMGLGFGAKGSGLYVFRV